VGVKPIPKYKFSHKIREFSKYTNRRPFLLKAIGVWILFSIGIYVSGYFFILKNERELRQKFWTGQCNHLQEFRLKALGETEIDYAAIRTLDGPKAQIRSAFRQLESWGCLPYGHYFILGIETTNVNLVLSQNLKDQYPEEIWLYIQYQFRNVTVLDGTVAVTLYFDGKPQRVIIPLEAITYFEDPKSDFLIDLRPASPLN